VPKIEKLFDQFAIGASTVLTGTKKNWPKVKQMSRAKNADVWAQVWTKTARPAAISALKSAKLGLTDTQIKALADDYNKKRKLEFVKQTTKTDIKRLKVLARSKGDLEGEIKEAGISRPSRKFLIEDNESIEAAKELLRGGHKAVGFTKKTSKTTSNKPCEICRAREGETVGIDKAYKGGQMTAHYHQNCHCEDVYS
jgi:hypothetical protein